MFPGTNLFYSNLLKALMAGCVLALIGSCTIVKKYQPGKPFVYKTKINLIGNFSNEEKEELVSGLEQQLDDSMQDRRVDKLLYRVLKNPPVYDSTNADNSIVFMKALLRSLGYFNDSIYYQHEIEKEGKDEYRTFIDFYVTPGKVVKLDTVTYNLKDSNLQRLTDSTQKQAIVKKGDDFAKAPISAELDRLTDVFRNSGYLRFSRDELVGIWDTLDVSLLQPGLDPFEQLDLLERLRARRENPTASLEIRLKSIDSAKLTRFYMGNVTVYPDYLVDTIGLKRQDKIVEGIRVIQFRKKFKAKIFPPNIYLPHDSIYRQRRYLRTINRFNSLGTWQLVNIDQFPRANEDTVDFVIRLTPAKKYAFNTNLEGSINQNALSGNLFGSGVNVGLQNKNFAKGANVANSNVRFGIELGNTGSKQFIQTQQVSFSHNIYFPRFIPGTKYIPEKYRDNLKTLFSFSAANTERRFLYNLTTINGAWGYEFQRKNILLTVKLPNIEYSNLYKRDSLRTLISENPSLNNIFTDGFISSVIGNVVITGGSGNRLNKLTANVEESGLLTGIIRNNFLDKQLYRFVKADVEFAHLIRLPKSAIALRAFVGAGYEFNSTRDPIKRLNLPFFKQFISGGPNSMRAWALRRLGPGSTVKDFDGKFGIPDRYGDVQLEANVEYRFPIGKPFGVKVNGAFFTDAGNVWFMKSAAGRPAEEVFKLSRLGADIAIGSGGGLRIDFNFFVVRFDYAYKVKDPSPSLTNARFQNKWFSYPFFKGSQFQLGINYPFIF